MSEKELIQNLGAVIAGAEELQKSEREEADQRAVGTVFLQNALVHLREANSQLGLKEQIKRARKGTPGSGLPAKAGTPN